MARFEVADDGIPGLTLALRLRLKGHEVSLVDRGAAVVVDNAFTLPAPYRDIFLKSGGAIEDELAIAPAPGRAFSIAGVDLAFPSVGQHSTVIAAHFGASAGEQWNVLMRSAADAWSGVRSGAYSSPSSLRTLATRTLRDRRLRLLLDEYVAAYGLTPMSTGKAAVVLPYLDQTFGRWEFADGMGALESALRQRCHALGVAENPNHGEYISVESFWSHPFTPPTRWWRKARVHPVASHSLGLPWIGMAAEHIADRIGRAH